MTIPPRFLDEIRSRLALSDIIGKRVSVTRAGREFKACCPFHKEKTPSFTINDDKQFYHCFGCGAHGDVIGFVMQHDNLSFIDAVEMLSAEAGLQMPKPDPQAVKKAAREKDLHTLMDAATDWFAQQLYTPGNRTILTYLKDRGLAEKTLHDFRVGYAPADRQALRAYLKAEGYDDAAMIEAGLLKRSERSEQPYAFFRERIMFPVADRRGRIVAFGGRVLPDHMRAPDREGFKPPKYINSSDTPLFDKGRMLYGESQARQAARDGQPVIVTEGYMDVIACHQAGFRGAVAPMGTALTEDQILSLWSMIPDSEKTPVLCFDGDDAGRRAASRSCARVLPLLKPAQSVKFAFMPEGEDPDSLIRGGGSTAFEKVLGSSLSLFDFIWASHTAGRELKTPEQRAGVVRDLNNEVQAIADRDIQSHYQSLLRERVSATFFSNTKRYAGRAALPVASRPGLRVRRPVFSAQDMPVKIFLATLLNHPQVFEAFEEHLGRFNIPQPGLARLRSALIGALEEEPALDRVGLAAHLSLQGLSEEMHDILNESVYVHAAFARPAADSNESRGKLLDWLEELQDRERQDIEAGWKDAFHASSEEDEEKIRQMMKIRVHEGS
jgi:DNA primase